MKANFIKASYGLVVAPIVTIQLIATPLALSSGQTELAANRMNSECQDGECT